MKKYCHLCGALNKKDKTQPWECTGCGNLSFENPRPTVDIVIFDKKGRALVSERAIDPAKGRFDLPGGFIEGEENLETGARRELHEETLLKDQDYGEFTYIESHNVGYPFSKETVRAVGAIFATKLTADAVPVAQDDVASVKFVSLDELDEVDFSLEFYPYIIRIAHKKLFG